MTYEEWEEKVPEAIKRDPTWGFYGYRKALFLYDLVWIDCQKLLRDPRGRPIVDQVIDSAGSISANIEEGYGRGFQGKEYQQFLRYAVASARETKGWYFRGRHLLPSTVVEHRLALIDEVISLIITEMDRQRKRK